MTDASEPIDLTGYQIVIPGNSTDNNSVESLSAYELKDALTGLGYTLNVVADNGSSSVNAKSILIGKTAATEGDIPTGNQYLIKADANGLIQISAGNYYGYRAALSFLTEEMNAHGGILAGVYSSTANVPHVEHATDDSVRVMFYNVFGWNSWYDESGKSTSALFPYQLRMDLQKDLIEAYAPDVVGFQEYMSTALRNGVADYHSKFTPIMTALGYTQISTTAGNANCTPLFYKTDKYDVVESGYQLYSENGSGSKSVTWAVFREKATGKAFSVFNTHFVHEESNNEGRVQNAKELLSVINTVTAKYQGISAIMGGDLNYWNIWETYKPDEAAIGSYLPHKELTTGGMVYMHNVAEKSVGAPDTDSYHGYFGYNATKKIFNMGVTTILDKATTNPDTYTLDHIFLGGNKDGIDAKKCIIITDDAALRASDHSPTYVDFILN